MKNLKHIAVLGIHTGIGKTLCSAVLVRALEADYWKPVQAGSLDYTDSMHVSDLIADANSVVHPEAYRLTEPLSPHQAAHMDGVKIDVQGMHLPVSSKTVIIETAGGVMSPMNDEMTMVDVVQHFQLPCVLVVRHYLGSINHSLTALEVLRSRGVQVLGIVVSGTPNEASESYIRSYTHISCWAHVPEMHEFTPHAVSAAGQALRDQLKYWSW